MTTVVKDDFKGILAELRRKEGHDLVNEFERILRVRIPQDLNDLSAAASQNDMESLGKKAHFLSTTLITLKFTQGVELTDALEKSAKAGELQQSLLLTSELIQYLQRMIHTI